MIKSTSKWLFQSNNFLRVITWLAEILGLPAYLHKDLKLFVQDVCRLREYSGIKYTIQILKESHRILAKYLAGDPVRSAEIIGCGISKYGLPTILPVAFRKEIQSGNILVIRYSLTLLAFFRAMYQFPILKLSSITDGAKVSFSGMVDSFSSDLPHLMRWFREMGGCNPKLGKPTYQVINSAGPNGQATISAGFDAVAILLRQPSILLFGWKLGSRFSILFIILLAIGYSFYIFLTVFFINHSLLLGRLSLKEEAAGKVRVFAIVDYWTQSFMRPIHKWAFKLLKSIPQDGTFDHRAKANEVGKFLEESGKPAYSLDLSSATDRFPVNIQVEILAYFFGRPFAQSWKSVLVDRDYYLRKEDKYLRYSVGQPMGALSSWAVFALSHHFVVQWAHYRTGGKSWFSDYAIIGDDVVIFDTKVAEQYLVILGQLGVEVSMHKSLTSKTGVFEFAKQIHYKGMNLSPLNPNESIKAFRDDTFLVQWIEDLWQRGFNPSFLDVIRNSIRFGRGTVDLHRKVGSLPFWSRRIVVALTSPFGPFPVKPENWINLYGCSLISLNSSLIPRNRFLSKFAGDSRIVNANIKLIQEEWNQMCSKSFSTMFHSLELASQISLGFLRHTRLERALGKLYLIFGTPILLIILGKLDIKEEIFSPRLVRSRFGYSAPAWSQSLFDLHWPSSLEKKAYLDFKKAIDLHRFARQIAFSFPVEGYAVNQGYGFQNPVMGGPLTPFGDSIPRNEDMEFLIKLQEYSRRIINYNPLTHRPSGYEVLAISVIWELALIGLCLTT